MLSVAEHAQDWFKVAGRLCANLRNLEAAKEKITEKEGCRVAFSRLSKTTDLDIKPNTWFMMDRAGS